MSKEIIFDKYEKRGKDYHYKQINLSNPFTFNAFVYARYLKHILLLKKALKKCNFDFKKRLNLLDMGCGDAALIYMLKKHLPQYSFNIYGIDLSESALKTAEQKITDGVFSVSGVYETNFDNNFFDIILSSDVIEHVNSPSKMLKEAKRTAKKDAVIIFGTPIRYTEFPLDKMHVKEFFPDEFKQLFSEYFNKTEIVMSHKIIHLLKYRKTLKVLNKKIGVSRYLYYLKSLLSLNPFLDKPISERDLCSYMFAVAIKK
ncbi:MAG: class I SAM-dependent methyltransferase [Bacteroidales bacterium]|nr:class I SAM-dependent methyltransferase [Bacteroidales bacterium]